MALETLQGIAEVDGFPVLSERPRKENGDVDWALFDELRKTHPVYIDHDVNMVSFRIQNGPVKEAGVNGCQVDTLIRVAQIMLEGLDRKFPCIENSNAIADLQMALEWLALRKRKREEQGVEGRNLPHLDIPCPPTDADREAFDYIREATKRVFPHKMTCGTCKWMHTRRSSPECEKTSGTVELDSRPACCPGWEEVEGNERL